MTGVNSEWVILVNHIQFAVGEKPCTTSLERKTMKRQRLIVFTGAGISVESGIPTFQEQPGIRDKLTRDFANEHPEEYRDTIRSMVNCCENANPNAAHLAIAELIDCPVITMNVDGLHTKAGSSNVIEIHGTLPTREMLEEYDFPLTYDGIVLYGD